MIYSAPAGSSYAPAVGSAAEHEATPGIYVAAPASDSPPPSDFGSNFVAEKLECQPIRVPLLEHFDWNCPETNREYIHLEQKVLAGKSTEEETSRYRAMKRDRNSIIFADRYITDYAEIKRIQILSIKIAELQKYLRPIKIG
jgi:hypothetical protein